MTTRIPLYCLIFLFSLMSYADETGSACRQIAVTFDDLPASIVQETSEMQEITTAMLQVLSENKIPAIGFVNEKKLYVGDIPDPERVRLLSMWLDAGLELGNHTFSHLDLHLISVKDFERDTLKGEEVIRPLSESSGSRLLFFRHPYLHTGMDLTMKKEFTEFLVDHGYRIAPVTIDNSEWIFNVAYRKAEPQQREAVGREYVAYMNRMVEYYESQSRALFQREISQVLLLHANSINSHFLKDILAMLRSRGYRFVSLEEALKDPAYNLPDLFTGRGGISWIHRWAIAREVPKSFFQGEPTTPMWIQTLAGVTE